jgi:alpha-N-arabinofuranosidase
MKLKSLLMAAGLLAFAFVLNYSQSNAANRGAAVSSQSANAIRNPSFEQMGGGRGRGTGAAAPTGRGRGGVPGPSGWMSATNAGSGVLQSDPNIAHTGSRSVSISSEEGIDASWNSNVTVEPFARYSFSGWIKTENVAAKGGKGALFNLQGTQTATKPLTGTNDWTQVSFEFNTESRDSVLLNCTLGGAGLTTGKAWFDDVTLTLLSRMEIKPSVSIDASKKREPMEKYIYGQFIEHLGRCIYGGIWAEMLQDRKFYSSVDEVAAGGRSNTVSSPWKSVGGEGVITMVTEGTFIEKLHTPQVNLGEGGTPKGIIQSKDTPAGKVEADRVARLTKEGAKEIPDLGPGLGIVKGKGYAGYVILAGDKSAAPIEVSLIWGDGPKDRQTFTIKSITKDYKKYNIKFKAGATTDSASFQIVGKGKGKFKIGPPSLMPDDNIKGMRADTLKLLKELNSPIYRWPGGNFVSGYNWKDGIGDRDKRPPRKNPAWQGIEHNDFGMHEFFVFLSEVKAEPFIALNAGLGSAEAAAQEVEYVNGNANTEMGKLRVANGGPKKPWKCTYWAVGNEMSGGWQLGNVPLEQFIKRHSDFSAGLLKVDPSIKLIASGEATNPRANDWDRQLLAGAAKYIDLLSKHFYQQENLAAGIPFHVRRIPNSIRSIAESQREYLKTIPEIKEKHIEVSLDEWNYWYGPHVFGELGTRYFLKDGLGIAAGINEYSRNTDVIFMANYAQTVNVIGLIKTNKTAAEFETTGLVLKMYRQNFGTIPVEVAQNPAPLDVAAALTADGKKLTISIINPADREATLSLNLNNVKIAGKGKLYVMAGDDPQAYNNPGDKPRIVIAEKNLSDITNKLVVPKLSASLYVLDIK